MVGAVHSALQLTNTELKLLVHLINAKGNVVSRKNLLTGAWGMHPESALQLATARRRVDVTVGRIRSKISKASERAAKAIMSVSSEGYKLHCHGVRWVK